MTGGAWGSVLTGAGLNEFEKDGLDWEKLGMKLEELESSPNRSLKSLTDVSVLCLKSVTGSDLTGSAGMEGIGGRGSRGMAAGSGRSKSGSNRACCNLECAGAGFVGPNPRMDWRYLLSSLGLGEGTVGSLEEGFGGLQLQNSLMGFFLSSSFLLLGDIS